MKYSNSKDCWIKHNLLTLAKEHKATCKLFPEKCTVDLISVTIVLDRLGIKTTQKEREELS